MSNKISFMSWLIHLKNYKSLKNAALLCLSSVLLVGGIGYVGFRNVIEGLMQFSIWTVAAVLAVLFINFGLVSFRLKKLLHYFHVAVPFSVTLKASLQGYFASLFVVSLLGNVVGRLLILRRFGITPMLLASLTVVERVVLLFVSSIFCFWGVTWLFDIDLIINFLSSTRLAQIALVATVAFFASIWFGKSRFERKLFAVISSKEKYAQYFWITVLTILGQGSVMMTFVLAGLDLDANISLVGLFAAAAITSFVASLPISVNGWGVREMAAIFAFSQLGLSVTEALAISILVGLCSTAVVLVAVPFSFLNWSRKFEEVRIEKVKSYHLSLEKSSAWVLMIGCTVFIFFQIHVPVQSNVLNLNLADPFAFLALAAVATQCICKPQLPAWWVPRFNTALFAVSALLLFAFLNGLQTIGVTQWALTGRLFGWTVLLGYLSVGALTATYLGKVGLFRSIETLIASAVVVVLFSAIMRLFVFSGLLDYGLINSNFEGFSENRNALAFQLLICSALLISFTKNSDKLKLYRLLGRFRISRNNLIALAHGILLAGVVYTGSKTGMLTGALLIFFAFVTVYGDRRFLLSSLFFALSIWVNFVYVIPEVSELLLNLFNYESYQSVRHGFYGVQSALSNEVSTIVRWQTIIYGFEMWTNDPWIGAGLGMFVETSLQWFEERTVIHSTPLWILAEFGILGLAVLIGIAIWTAVSMWRPDVPRTTHRAVIMLLLVFVVFGLAHDVFYQRIFWLALGLCLARPFRNFAV